MDIHWYDVQSDGSMCNVEHLVLELFTLWIPLFQSLGTPLTMLPFYWLNLGSLYLALTTTWTPFATIGFTLGKTIVSCLVTSTDSTLLHILIPWIVASYWTT
jgi:hypothetical protein